MDTRYEHLKWDKKGRIEAVGVVKAKEAMGVATHDYWGKIEHVIQEYTRLHPAEINEVLAYCERKRESNFNDFGTLDKESGTDQKNSALHLGFAMPNGLLVALLAFDPDFLQNRDKLNRFRRLYKGFNTSKKV